MWKTTVCGRMILAGCAALAALPLVATGASFPSTNVTVRVTVVTAACILDPNDTTILLDLKNIISRDLQTGRKQQRQRFVIHLKNCDPSIKNAVVVTMKAENETNGLIPSSATGIAVGLETMEGTAVTVDGRTGTSFALTTGDNDIALRAYVTATSKDFTLGPFRASASFALSYP